jgi:uncharacterized RDD family membrane protein YckC
MPARPFEQTVDVETPELVVLTYSLAGIGSRVLAGLTDLFICIGTLFAIAVAVVMLGGRISLASDLTASWGTALLILAQFVILWGYYVLFEGLMDGQTPGKRLHRLRVVREGGYSVTFGVSAVRNLVRMLDMQPGVFYLVGLTSLFFETRAPTRRSRGGDDRRAGRRPPPRGAGTRQARPDTRHGGAADGAERGRIRRARALRGPMECIGAAPPCSTVGAARNAVRRRAARRRTSPRAASARAA